MLAQATQPAASILTPEVLAAVSAAIILVVGALAAAIVKAIGKLTERVTEAKTAAAVADVKATNADARVARNAARTDVLMMNATPPGQNPDAMPRGHQL